MQISAKSALELRGNCILDALGAFGPPWGSFGSPWGCLGSFLASSGGPFGPPLGAPYNRPLGRLCLATVGLVFWVRLGALWAALARSPGTLWALEGSLGALRIAFFL